MKATLEMTLEQGDGFVLVSVPGEEDVRVDLNGVTNPRMVAWMVYSKAYTPVEAALGKVFGSRPAQASPQVAQPPAKSRLNLDKMKSMPRPRDVA